MIARLRQNLGAKWSTVLLLLPPALFGSLYFGVNAALIIIESVFITMVAGIIICLIDHKNTVRLFNPGSIITGLLIGLTLSTQTPLYMIIIGACVAEFIGKHAFSTKQLHWVNPAVLGRTAIAILETIDPIPYGDLSTGASALFKESGGLNHPDYFDIFLGLSKGSIGETSALILLVVGVLMLRYVVIKREAALAMLLSVPIVAFVAPDSVKIIGHAQWTSDPILYLIGGPTMLIAFFFLTDPATTPNTRWGGVLFGIGVGVFAVLGKMYTTIAGVEMYGILLMNLLTPRLNKITAAHKRTPSC